jgi:glycerophosphoryl diester phosphodiesterase
MRIVGHRGARFEAPENTLEGFRYAIDLGLQAIELDVRLARDGELIVIHDNSVDRTTDGTGKISEMTLDEIRLLDARSIHTDWARPCPVPTLGESLDAVALLPVILVEIKRDTHERLDEVVPKTVAAIRERGLEQQVLIISFDTYALELAQREAPQIVRGYIGDWNDPAFLDEARRLECGWINPNHPKADRDLVARAKAEGFGVSAWPTNTDDDLAGVLALDPDEITTDAPTWLLPQLAARGIATDVVSRA